jgi:hypothetical protein
MPSDRQRRRAVLLAMGVVCSTMATGCLTSSFVRRPTEPRPERTATATESSKMQEGGQSRTQIVRIDESVRSASVKAADESTAAAAAPATPFEIAPGPASPAPAGTFPIELQVVPTESNGKFTPGSAGAPPAAPSGEQPAPNRSKTPLLDAQIQRVADITRQQRDEIAANPIHDETE